MVEILTKRVNDRLAVGLIIIIAAVAVSVVWWQLSLILKPVIYYSDFPYLQIPRIKGSGLLNSHSAEAK